jgi:aminomethyltransferase
MKAMDAPVPAPAYAHASWGDATVAAVSLTGQPGFRIFCAAEELPAIIAQLETAGARPANDQDVRRVRIENGLPRYGEDIRETSLPQETQQMHGVSFTKGCYLGQEIVERIRAQGHVNKKLVRLRAVDAAALAAGAKLSVNGADAGEVTSTAGDSALAYVRTSFAEAGTELDAGGTKVRVA